MIFASLLPRNVVASASRPVLVWASLVIVAIAGSATAFQLKTGDVSYSWNTLSRFVMPGETVRFEVGDPDVKCGWAISAGELQGATESSVDWVVPQEPGTYAMAANAGDEVKEVNLFVMIPYDSIKNGALHGFRIGRYPKTNPFPSFNLPRGFIEVTPDNINTPVSPRYTLAEFVPRQPGSFPKYLVLREELIRKLELFTDLIQAKGYKCDKLTIFSGYRTPAYQHQIGGGKNSAHAYGGAADIFIDHNGDGMMDDLNRDGSCDSGDSKLLARLVDELESDYPDLVGGCGWYRRTRARGPFIHIDVRGEPMRWHQ